MFNEIYECFRQAELCDSELLEVSMAEMLYESEETDKKLEKNQKTEEKKKGLIQTGFDKLIATVKNIIKSVKEFFGRVFMSSDEKEQYKKFKQYLKENPELAKKEVDIEKFEVYNDIYDDALKDLDKCKTNDEMSKVVNVMNSKLKEAADNTSTVAKRASMRVTLDTALDIANENLLFAKGLNLALQTELIDLEDARKELGNKAVDKFTRKVEKYSNMDDVVRGTLHTLKVNILNRKKNSLIKVLNEQRKSIMAYTNYGKYDIKGRKKPIVSAGSLAKGTLLRPSLTKDAFGGWDNVADAAKKYTKTAYNVNKTKRSLKRFKRKAKKDLEDFVNI